MEPYPALPADEAILLLFAFLLVGGGDGQAVAVYIEVDVLLLKARQLGTHEVMIAFVEDIGLTGGLFREVVEETVKISEGVKQVVVSVFKRNEIKHKANLQKFCFFGVPG